MMIVGGGVLSQLLSTVSAVIGARMLGVEGRGQIVLVSSLAVMASQLTFGGSLPNAITKLLADRGVTARDGLRHLVPRLSLWAFLPASLAGGYLLFLYRDLEGPTRYALALAVVIGAVQTMAMRILVGAMLGEGADLIHVALTSVVPQAVVTLVLGTAYVMGVRWSAVELVWIVTGCISAVLVARLHVLAKPTRLASDAIDGRELYRLARRTHIGSVGPLDGLGIDRTLVGSLLGSAQLGLYSAAFALGGLTSILGGCLAMIVLPRVAIAQQDPPTERMLVRRWLLMSATLLVLVVLLLELTAEWLIRVTFGAEFQDATTCARWLVAACGLLDFRRVLIAILQGRDRGGQASVIELALTPLLVLGIVVASFYDSLVGVGVSMTAVAVIGCAVLGIAVARCAPVNRRKHRRSRREPEYSLPAVR